MISVVIPTKDNARTLPALLNSINLQDYKRNEIVVVDNGSSDSTCAIAESFGCAVLHSGPERSSQRNAGAAVSKGDLLLFVDSDMELTPGLLAACAAASEEADALCIREEIVGSDYWTRVRAFERSRYFRSDLFEAARCFRKAAFERLGGYDVLMTGLEDLDLHARCVEAGYRVGWVDVPIRHHEEDIDLGAYLKKRRYYGRTDRTYVEKHPNRAREQRSVYRRLKVLFSPRVSIRELTVVPGLVILRGLETLERPGFGPPPSEYALKSAIILLVLAAIPTALGSTGVANGLVLGSYGLLVSGLLLTSRLFLPSSLREGDPDASAPSHTGRGGKD